MLSSLTFCSTLAVLLCLKMALVLGRPAGKPDNMEKALSYLVKYEYLVNDGRAGHVRTKEELTYAIKLFQSMAGLGMTGSLDNKTMEMMQAPRCGMSDFARSSGTRKKRYSVQGTLWPKKSLTYMYSDKGPTLSITMQQVKEQMDRAFKEWQRHADLTFTETSDPKADILIRFESGYHDDGYPFDGKGGTLAHGFYPQTALSGDVHFDDDEDWKIDEAPEGADFYWTALHEIGHSLGLDHSNHKAAVMYPFILGFRKNLVLDDDDISGIRYLYGMPNISIKTAPAPTMTKLLIPTKFRSVSPCHKHFDAVFVDKDLMTYFLTGKYYWTVDEDARRRGPYQTNLKWRHLPTDGVDAAYHTKGITTFFKGKHCWVYNGTEYMKGPVNISTVFRGLNSSVENIDAALVWGANGKTYLFKDDQYWRFNEVLNEIDMGYPVHINTSWSGVPPKINSAMTWINGKTYFFKDNNFWLFNNHEFRVQEVEPLKTNTYWMKCTEMEMNWNGSNRQEISFTLFFLVLFALLNMTV